MVRQTQKVNQLRESQGVLGESPLRQQKEKDGGGWFSRIATFFKSLGRPRVDNQVREEVVRNRRKIPTQKGDPVIESIRVRSNNASKASGKSQGKTVRSTTTKNKAKSKALPKG
jgi:hypothetical protein